MAPKTHRKAAPVDSTAEGGTLAPPKAPEGLKTNPEPPASIREMVLLRRFVRLVRGIVASRPGEIRNALVAEWAAVNAALDGLEAQQALDAGRRTDVLAARRSIDKARRQQYTAGHSTILSRLAHLDQIEEAGE